MRFLLTGWGSRGDVEPLVALAERLRAHGAGVRLCVPPDFAGLAAAAGVEHVPLGPAVTAVVAGEKRPTAQDAFRLAAELVAARFAVLPDAAEGCAAMVATGLMPAGARSVADRLGLRYVLACFQVFGLPSPHFPPGMRPGVPSPAGETDLRTLWRQDAERVDALYAAAENAHRAAIGLPPLAGVRDYAFGDRPWLAADPVLAPWAGLTDYDLVQTGAWTRDDRRPLPADLLAFLDAGEPPVYVGFGSIAAFLPAGIADVAVAAVRARGRRVLIGRGWAGLAPAGCFTVGEVNQQALFRRVAAVVHHGGAGTTHTAARAGVPQVVVPQLADQPMWAERVAALGIGVAHDGGRPTVASLSAALATALEPRTRERAAEVAGTMRTDGAEVAARLLLTPGKGAAEAG
jgi:vancomycin aglycone glucosyltransferase